MANKGYNIDVIKQNDIMLNNINEYGFNLREKQNNDNFFKENIRHRNMRNSIKPKEKK